MRGVGTLGSVTPSTIRASSFTASSQARVDPSRGTTMNDKQSIQPDTAAVSWAGAFFLALGLLFCVLAWRVFEDPFGSSAALWAFAVFGWIFVAAGSTCLAAAFAETGKGPLT